MSDIITRSIRSPALPLPLQITSEGQMIAKIGKQCKLDKSHCSIFLEGKISLSPSSSSSISVRFKLEDSTKIKASIAQTGSCYAFDCPLSSKPFAFTFTTEASCFRPLKIETNNCPVKRQELEYFEQELNCFIGEISRSFSIQYTIDIEATACIRREIWYNEAMDIMREIEGEGVKKESSEVSDECSDCAVCLEAVQMSWLDGLRLPCMHVFHFKCIASWFQLKDTCPTCRRSISEFMPETYMNQSPSSNSTAVPEFHC